MSKNRPDAGTLDIPIQRAIFGQKVCPLRVFDIASASTGSLREYPFLDYDLHFLVEIRASGGAIPLFSPQCQQYPIRRTRRQRSIDPLIDPARWNYRHIRIKLEATSIEAPAFLATLIGPSD